MRRLHLTGALAIALLPIGVATGPASATTYTQILGSGSTWAGNAVQQWVADADVDGIKVVYSASGSTSGRTNFAQKSVDFAITDLPYQGIDEHGAPDTSGGREYAYVPFVGGGTAFTYQLRIDGSLVRNLRLSGETVAKIFTNQITSWDDPAIAEDNNGRAFPSLPITPVVHSEASGATAQLTSWMDDLYPAIWRPYSGAEGPTAYYPRQGDRMVSGAGSDQVTNTVKGFSGNGAIGYVEATYPVTSDFPMVALENEAGYFVEPTGYNAAVALTDAVVGDDQVADLDGVHASTDPRAYPISSYSYLIIPTAAADARMTTAKRQTLLDFATRSLCAGQGVARFLGYAPLPSNLVDEAFDRLALLGAADGNVNLVGRDASSCGTPDYDDIAPMPEACQQRGAGPCGSAGPPTSTRAPAILGPVRVGASVQVDAGDWTGDLDSYDVQWLAGGHPIAGATTMMLRLPVSLLGTALSVAVTGRSDEFVEQPTVVSRARPVARGRLEGGRLVIGGRAVVGRTLVVRGSRVPGADVTVQWYVGGRKILGADTIRWTVRRAQVGKHLTVRATATRRGYETLVRRSPRSPVVRD